MQYVKDLPVSGLEVHLGMSSLLDGNISPHSMAFLKAGSVTQRTTNQNNNIYCDQTWDFDNFISNRSDTNSRSILCSATSTKSAPKHDAERVCSTQNSHNQSLRKLLVKDSNRQFSDEESGIPDFDISHFCAMIEKVHVKMQCVSEGIERCVCYVDKTSSDDIHNGSDMRPTHTWNTRAHFVHTLMHECLANMGKNVSTAIAEMSDLKQQLLIHKHIHIDTQTDISNVLPHTHTHTHDDIGAHTHIPMHTYEPVHTPHSETVNTSIGRIHTHEGTYMHTHVDSEIKRRARRTYTSLEANTHTPMYAHTDTCTHACEDDDMLRYTNTHPHKQKDTLTHPYTQKNMNAHIQGNKIQTYTHNDKAAYMTKRKSHMFECKNTLATLQKKIALLLLEFESRMRLLTRASDLMQKKYVCVKECSLEFANTHRELKVFAEEMSALLETFILIPYTLKPLFDLASNLCRANHTMQNDGALLQTTRLCEKRLLLSDLLTYQLNSVLKKICVSTRAHQRQTDSHTHTHAHIHSHSYTHTRADTEPRTFFTHIDPHTKIRTSAHIVSESEVTHEHMTPMQWDSVFDVYVLQHVGMLLSTFMAEMCEDTHTHTHRCPHSCIYPCTHEIERIQTLTSVFTILNSLVAKWQAYDMFEDIKVLLHVQTQLVQSKISIQKLEAGVTDRIPLNSQVTETTHKPSHNKIFIAY